MDLLSLIDELDNRLHNAKPVPLTDQVRLDKNELYDLLDQMRGAFPEEIKQARWIVEQAERDEPSSGGPLPVLSVSVDEARETFDTLLHRVRFGGERFLVELQGTPMAQIGPPA